MAYTFDNTTLPGYLTVNGARRRFFELEDMDLIPGENSVLIKSNGEEMRVFPADVSGASDVDDVMEAIVTGAGGEL